MEDETRISHIDSILYVLRTCWSDPAFIWTLNGSWFLSTVSWFLQTWSSSRNQTAAMDLLSPLPSLLRAAENFQKDGDVGKRICGWFHPSCPVCRHGGSSISCHDGAHCSQLLSIMSPPLLSFLPTLTPPLWSSLSLFTPSALSSFPPFLCSFTFLQAWFISSSTQTIFHPAATFPPYFFLLHPSSTHLRLLPSVIIRVNIN